MRSKSNSHPMIPCRGRLHPHCSCWQRFMTLKRSVYKIHSDIISNPFLFYPLPFSISSFQRPEDDCPGCAAALIAMEKSREEVSGWTHWFCWRMTWLTGELSEVWIIYERHAWFDSFMRNWILPQLWMDTLSGISELTDWGEDDYRCGRTGSSYMWPLRAEERLAST